MRCAVSVHLNKWCARRSRIVWGIWCIREEHVFTFKRKYFVQWNCLSEWIKFHWNKDDYYMNTMWGFYVPSELCALKCLCDVNIYMCVSFFLTCNRHQSRNWTLQNENNVAFWLALKAKCCYVKKEKQHTFWKCRLFFR